MERPRGLPKRVEKATRDEMPLYSDEAEADLIEISLKLTKEKIEDYKQSQAKHLHRLLVEQCMEEHEKRVGGIKLLFKQKRTGLPF